MPFGTLISFRWALEDSAVCLKVSNPKIFISRSTDLNIKVIPCSVDQRVFNNVKTMTTEFLLQPVTASEPLRAFGKQTLRF